LASSDLSAAASASRRAEISDSCSARCFLATGLRDAEPPNTAGNPSPSPSQRDENDAEETNRIRSRYGKSSPPGSAMQRQCCGQETAPRTPVKAITNTVRQDVGSRARRRWFNSRGR